VSQSNEAIMASSWQRIPISSPFVLRSPTFETAAPRGNYRHFAEGTKLYLTWIQRRWIYAW